MLEDRDYMRKGSGASYWSSTVALIVLNVAAFVAQKTILFNHDLDGSLALSLDGLKHGFVWQLITFQFLHVNWLHLLFNCLSIFFFGRAVEMLMGRIRFLQLYFLSGIAGGLLQM